MLTLLIFLLLGTTKCYSLAFQSYFSSNSRLQSVSIRSSFFGKYVNEISFDYYNNYHSSTSSSGSKCYLTMRKQKASDRRTRRRQSGEDNYDNLVLASPVTSVSSGSRTERSSSSIMTSPMDKAIWNKKKIRNQFPLVSSDDNNNQVSMTGITPTAGRGRSRKRTNLYLSLSHYHQHFLKYLTMEYQAEEDEVLGRIKASVDHGSPIDLEVDGYALYDMYVERRGNLFSDEVYRLIKAFDATTSYNRDVDSNNNNNNKNVPNYLPSSHKFSNNDVILLTLQPTGSGDFFYVPSAILSASSSSDDDTNERIDNESSSFLQKPTVSIEARVLNVGPTYIDIVTTPGIFERSFGVASNDMSGLGDKSMRFRTDLFFSEVPYQRMVTALTQLTTVIPKNIEVMKQSKDVVKNNNNNNVKKQNSVEYNNEKSNNLDDNNSNKVNCMDGIFREVILSTFALTDLNSPLYNEPSICNIDDISKQIARPPMGPLSQKLTYEVLQYIRANPHSLFRRYNSPQLLAIEAALTRRLTLIQGPPGTGKTDCAATIGFGFVHQCRSISSSNSIYTNHKVLACAFSNVGADNLAEALMKLGLNVVRIGKPSAVSQSLWNNTLEAAIDRDPDVQKARLVATQVNEKVLRFSDKNNNKKTSKSYDEQRAIRSATTSAVKASIEASNIAATKALREADVIVSTLTGSSDPRLLAACGIIPPDAEPADDPNRSKSSFQKRNGKAGNQPGTTSSDLKANVAPDGQPPLSLPFVIIDEACQALETATLIPIVSSDSCRAVVLLGDPCQLPPTVINREAIPALSLSLMERLATKLIITNAAQPKKYDLDPQDSSSTMNDSFLNSLPVKQAVSLLTARSKSGPLNGDPSRESYRKLYNGSFLLSVQYRMHPSIAALPSALFYNALLATPTMMSDIRSFPSSLAKAAPCSDMSLSVRVINVGGKGNERRGEIPGTSVNADMSTAIRSSKQTTCWNEPEAQCVITLIKTVINSSSRDQTDSNLKSIGVVTPYLGQVQLIKSMIATDCEIQELLSRKPFLSIEVKSVDGYQGREQDVIIFSCVRSNRQQQIGFLSDWRRLNVGLTRAKSALVIVCDLETLSGVDKYWDALRKWATGVACVFDFSDFAFKFRND